MEYGTLFALSQPLELPLNHIETKGGMKISVKRRQKKLPSHYCAEPRQNELKWSEQLSEGFSMKRKLLWQNAVLLVLSLLFFSGSAFALPISVDDGIKIYDDTSSTNATINGGYGGAYIAVSADGKWDNFTTFCLEVNETLSYGTEFYVGDISTAAKNGGVGGAEDGQDEISSFTAWLYDQVVTNQITSSYLDEVQYAIWYAENEITTLSDSAQSFYDTQYGLFVDSGWTGLGNTRVINLVDSSGNARQDLLVSVNSVPEPGVTLFLGICMLGFAVVRSDKLISK